MIAMLFYNPMELHSGWMLWLLLPLLVGVAVVYKTVRAQEIRRLPLETLVLVGYMLGGLTALGAALWVIQQYWP